MRPYLSGGPFAKSIWPNSAYVLQHEFRDEQLFNHALNLATRPATLTIDSRALEGRVKRPNKARKTPRKRELLVITSASAERLRVAAETARYAGSPYHRLPSSKMGKPSGRNWPTASKCDPEWTFESATNALRTAIRAGTVSAKWEGQYPCFAWHLVGDVLYEARLSNREKGEYHAYPLESKLEWPNGLR